MLDRDNGVILDRVFAVEYLFGGGGVSQAVADGLGLGHLP